MPFSFDATDAMFQEGGAMYKRGQMIGRVKIKRAVAVAGSIGDWVARNGYKISEEEARQLFQQFDEMASRRQEAYMTTPICVGDPLEPLKDIRTIREELASLRDGKTHQAQALALEIDALTGAIDAIDTTMHGLSDGNTRVELPSSGDPHPVEAPVGDVPDGNPFDDWSAGHDIYVLLNTMNRPMKTKEIMEHLQAKYGYNRVEQALYRNSVKGRGFVKVAEDTFAAKP